MLKKLIAVFKGKEKAVAAFLAPIVLVQLSRFVPSFQADQSLIEQLLMAVLTSATVYATTNTPTNQKG